MLAVVIGPVANASVGSILIGMIVPGLMLAFSYIVYIFLRCLLRPQDGPPLRSDDDLPSLGARLTLTMQVLLPPVIVIICVIGSMMIGLATPTEAAATGALGTALLTLAYGRFTWPVLIDSTLRTVRITAMILFIVSCGSIFAAVFVGSGGLETLNYFMTATNDCPIARPGGSPPASTAPIW